jgi:hypothetical protein
MLFLLRLNIGKKPAPAPQQVPRAVALDGLDLDDLRPEVRQHHAASRPHHHVGELDHADAGERQALLFRRRGAHAATPCATAKVLGKPRAPHRALQGLAVEPARDAPAQVEQLRQVDPGGDAHAFEHEDKVFGVDVAAGAGRMRAAADAGQAGVEARDADLQRRIRIREPHAARVVEMAAPQPVARDAQGTLEQAAHHRRIGIADGVGKAHTVGAGIEQRLHQPQHFVRRDMALQRAAEGCAHAAVDQCLRARRVARRTHAGDLRHHLVGRLAQVGKAVRVAGRERHHHQVGLARDGPFGALEIGHQHRGEQARQRLRIREQLGRVGQLRQQMRGHERAHLDLALPRPRGRRVSIRVCVRWAARGRCSGGRRAGPLRGQPHSAAGRRESSRCLRREGTAPMVEVPIWFRRYILEAI